jgi:hypothetical protein
MYHDLLAVKAFYILELRNILLIYPAGSLRSPKRNKARRTLQNFGYPLIKINLL